MGYLENINSSCDLKKLNYAETSFLAEEIREKIIDTVSENGGHLASNLGVVELTLALHRSFDFPCDNIVFDVGHQCYVHKLLTGRNEVFSSLRKCGGISGFTNRFESEYDSFGAGHSGTSVSAALGLLRADKLNNKKSYSIAVVGDGSFTNGMIYEALNNCTESDSGLVVVLNDNEMSISKNVGAMSKYLSEFSNSRGYIKFKNKVYGFCLKTKLFGKALLVTGRFFKNALKKMFLNKNYFECLGLKYFGPIDGHDQELLELVFEQTKKHNCPCIVHIITKKGKGYIPAEMRPDIFHSTSPFDKQSGETKPAKYDFSSFFGDALTSLAEKDDRIVAVTAAMGYGTGLSKFTEKYPERFFDVGIAEEHALTFCAGMAAAGKRPVFAVYSSFLQRCYDQIIHDVAIQKLPVILAVDRAGLVPGDGMTHQGIYDSSFLLGIPSFEVYCPEDYTDLEFCLKSASESNCPVAIRYPKGCEAKYDKSDFVTEGSISFADVGGGNKRIAVISYGRTVNNCYEAAHLLGDGYIVRVIKLLKIKPVDMETLSLKCKDFDNILVVEEGIMQGGVAEKIASNSRFADSKVHIHAIDTGKSFSGNIDELFVEHGFSSEQIRETIREILG